MIKVLNYLYHSDYLRMGLAFGVVFFIIPQIYRYYRGYPIRLHDVFKTLSNVGYSMILWPLVTYFLIKGNLAWAFTRLKQRTSTISFQRRKL